MVQTRAQRNQSQKSGQPKPAEEEPAGLKAPARRGRSKKVEAEDVATTEKITSKRPTTTRKPTAGAAKTTRQPAKTSTRKAFSKRSTGTAKAATDKRTTTRRTVKAEEEKPMQTVRVSVDDPVEKHSSRQNSNHKESPTDTIADGGTVPALSPSKIPRAISPQRVVSAEMNTEALTSSNLPQAASNTSSPTRMPAVVAAISSTMKSSVLVNGDSRTFGSPRKPPSTPKLLLSPAKSRFGHYRSVTKAEQSIKTVQPVASSWEATDTLTPALDELIMKDGSPLKSCLRRNAEVEIDGRGTSEITIHKDLDREHVTTAPTEPQTSPRKTVSFRPSQAPSEVPECHILDGVRIFVDVRCANGEDGSASFEILLAELGAEVVSSWSTNVNRTPGKCEASGLTHVLWANGSTRTLEKVVATNGSVKCVNLSWPLDCEKYNIRLPETKYLIDFWIYLPHSPPKTTMSPMAVNSPNAAAIPPTPSTVVAGPPTLRAPVIAPTPARSMFFSPLKSAMGSFLIKTPSYLAGMATPAKPLIEDEKENIRPPSKDSSGDKTPLIQKTCPPKQVGRRLWLLDEVDTPLRGKSMSKRRLSQES